MKRGRRSHSGPDAFQQGEECVPVVCAVDVGRICLEQLVETVGHLPTDPGHDVRLHHQQETQRQENLRGWREDQGASQLEFGGALELERSENNSLSLDHREELDWFNGIACNDQIIRRSI